MRIGPPRSPRERLAALQTLAGAGLVPQSIADESLVAAWSGEIPLAVAYYLAQRGATAYIWPPESGTGRRGVIRCGPAVLRAIGRSVDAIDCPVSLCVTAVGREDQRSALRAAAFREIGEIRTMRLSLDSRLSKSMPREITKDEFLLLNNETAARFAAVIDRINRSEAERGETPRVPGQVTLEAHFDGVGSPSVSGCLLIRQDRDAAVILTRDLPEREAREIAYLGVIPECRRQGLATMFVGAELAAARHAGIAELVVTANAADAPATSLYTRLGFVATERRCGFLRPRGTNCESGDHAACVNLH